MSLVVREEKSIVIDSARTMPIEVIRETAVDVTLDRTPMSLVEVAQQGPAGPGVDASFIFVQDVPATVWNITHSLNKYPSVTIVDSAGTEQEGEVRHLSVGSLTITFSSGFAGKAFLN